MCGRIAQFGTFREIVELINIWNTPVQAEASPPRYNVAPATRVQVLNVAGDALLARRIRWGWRPHWATDKPAPINARSEKVSHGPFFRAIWPHPALCPIDGWYEWVDEGGPKKQPYFIRRRDGQPTLCASIGQFPHEEPQDSDGDAAKGIALLVNLANIALQGAQVENASTSAQGNNSLINGLAAITHAHAQASRVAEDVAKYHFAGFG